MRSDSQVLKGERLCASSKIAARAEYPLCCYYY